jgi:magnesium chelatase subunit I
VSVRLSVANLEALAANALRRGVRSGERLSVARIDDLEALAASSIGKIEIESLEEGREGVVFDNLLKAAVLTVFKDLIPVELMSPVVTAFEEGVVAHTGSDMSSDELAALLAEVPALAQPVLILTGGDETPAVIAAAVEFVLEGLHLSKRLNKDALGARATYRGRL